MKNYFLVLLAAAALFAGCCDSAKNESCVAIPVIFETDMGNDIDDALALDMLYKYADMGIVNLLGVGVNRPDPYSVEFIDVMNTWFGYPDVAIGKITNGVDCANDPPANFVKTVCLYQENGASPFGRTHTDYSQLPEAPDFYRELLAQQPDSSVVVVSVGFSTNLSRLLDSQPDRFSPLAGRDLVAQKVKLLSIMAGNLVEPTAWEYNVGRDVPAVQNVFNNWPTPIVVSPYDVGVAVMFPASVVENNLDYAGANPVKIGYESYMQMPYDRPSWDLTSVLYAVEGTKNYFTISEWGRIEVDNEAHTTFYANENGRHAYLGVNAEQAELVKNRLVELVSMKPKSK